MKQFLKPKLILAFMAVALVVMMVATIVEIKFLPIPARASSNQMVTIGMPFNGKWAYNTLTTASCGTDSGQTAHPSCHGTNGTDLLGYDWATDYYAASTTPVKVNGTSLQGTVTFSSTTASGSCGDSLTITAKVNNVSVGQMYVTHLDHSVVSSSLSSGDTIGTIHSQCFGVDHVHFSYMNTAGNHACYVNYSNQNYTAGMNVSYGAPIGVLGSSNTGVQQVCSSIPSNQLSTSSPPWPGVGSATFLNADHLNNGQVMTSSQYIVSGNVQHALIMQSDGNLVEYSGTTATWASNTGNHPGAYIGLQSDGNIVIYSSSGQALWATNTGGQSLSYLDMQDDGNLVAYSTSGSPIWASNTNNFSVFTFVGADHLNDGATLTSGNYIRSADKRYALLIQPDGNLVLYGPGYHVLWATGTSGHSGAYLGLQGDGNMVVYSSSGQALWASNTSGKSLSYLVLQTDGNLVAVNTSGSPIWATGTNGKI